MVETEVELSEAPKFLSVLDKERVLRRLGTFSRYAGEECSVEERKNFSSLCCSNNCIYLVYLIYIFNDKATKNFHFILNILFR